MGKQKITVEEVQKYAARGMSQSEIARALGVAFTTVMALVKKHNIPVTLGKHTTPRKKFVPPPPSTTEAERLAEIKQAAGITEDRSECTKSLVTPAEALKYSLKLPWDGKVKQMTPKDLTTELYDCMVDHTTFSDDEIGKMFGFTPDSFNVWLKKYGYPVRGNPPLLRAHDIGKTESASKTAASMFAEMDSRPMPTDDTTGFDCQDRHFLGIDDAVEFSSPADDMPIPFVPTEPTEGKPPVLEFFDGPKGSGSRLVTPPLSPINSAKLQITCREYSLGQLKTILAALPAGTTISGVLHISL